MFGGGLRHFLPQGTTGSLREDDIDVVAQARNSGYNVVLDRQGFDGIENSEKRCEFFSLFAPHLQICNFETIPAFCISIPFFSSLPLLPFFLSIFAASLFSVCLPCLI